MSTHPRLEARVSALERRQINTETHIEEVTGEITASVKQLSEDMAASFKQLSEDMAASFKQLSEYLTKTEESTEERFSKIETDITNIKEDIIDVKTTLKQHTVLLTQILEHLPK